MAGDPVSGRLYEPRLGHDGASVYASDDGLTWTRIFAIPDNVEIAEIRRPLVTSISAVAPDPRRPGSLYLALNHLKTDSDGGQTAVHRADTG